MKDLGEKVFYLEEHRPSLGIHRQLSITQPGDLSQPSKNPAGLIVCKHSLLGQHDRVRHVDLRVGQEDRGDERDRREDGQDPEGREEHLGDREAQPEQAQEDQEADPGGAALRRRRAPTPRSTYSQEYVLLGARTPWSTCS